MTLILIMMSRESLKNLNTMTSTWIRVRCKRAGGRWTDHWPRKLPFHLPPTPEWRKKLIEKLDEELEARISLICILVLSKNMITKFVMSCGNIIF